MSKCHIQITGAAVFGLRLDVSQQTILNNNFFLTTDLSSSVLVCLCCQVVLLLGYWDEFLHGNSQTEGSEEALGHTHSRELPAQKCQVSPPPYSLPDLRLVSH